MVQSLDYLRETASQTAGPYVHIGCTPNFVGVEGVFEKDLGSGPLYSETTVGERISLRGTVYDGAGNPLKDAVIEIWQADANGRYNSPDDPDGGTEPNFTGWGRAPSNMDTGEFAFETIKPGKVPFRNGGLMAPHITIWIVARGINIGLQTRLYFPEEEEANAHDPVLARIDPISRATLLAKKEGDHSYRFDIRLQGERETVFFDI